MTTKKGLTNKNLKKKFFEICKTSMKDAEDEMGNCCVCTAKFEGRLSSEKLAEWHFSAMQHNYEVIKRALLKRSNGNKHA